MSDYHIILTFPTTARDLYECLMDARKHSSFTGAPATIEDKEGTSFTAWDGYIEGEQVVLERGKKIVQKWKANEEDWPDGHWSEVVFLFSDTVDGARLEFYHSEIPEVLYESIAKGWSEYYWDPLRIYIER